MIRLIHGDCLVEVPKLQQRIDAVVTDPPWGVNHTPGSNNRFSKLGSGIVGDESPPDVRWMAEYPAIIWGGNNFCDQLPRSAGWLIWDKTHAETCRHSQAELAWSNVCKTVRWHREAYHGFMRKRDGWFHQHQKPVKLMEWCLSFLPEGCTVIDPYMGSGPVGIACVNTGRNFIGIEIDEGYYRIAERRISEAQAKRSELMFA